MDEKKQKKPRRWSDLGAPNWLMIGVLVILLLLLIRTIGVQMTPKPKELTWSEFMQAVEAGRIESCEVTGAEYMGKFVEGSSDERYMVSHVSYPDLSDEFQKLLTEKTNFRVEPRSPWPEIGRALLPWLILGFGLWLFLRYMRSTAGPGAAFTFGKSKAKLVTDPKDRRTFDDVAGIDEAKEEVEEIIQFLRDPERFQQLGARIPRGVLLIGPPGSGKTLLAKAIAGEAEVPFYSISGSDFVEMFVGVGASRVRDMFQQAKENSPCIVFLDEIDAVGRRRGAGLGGGHDEREQTLNAMLVEMDGFASNEKVIVVAATNRPDVLDPALLRPGRFDRRIFIDLPDIKGREAILRVHAKKVKAREDVDWAKLAKATPMFSGADLENLVNEAALDAVMKEKDAIETTDLEEARDKVLWGKEKKSRVMDDEDRRVIAYHEAGHAIAAFLLQGEVDEIHKVTIIPRGKALGATMHLPAKDIYNKTRKRLMAEMAVLYAGRIAEELFCDDISTGAQNDIEQVTATARQMVCRWGMSSKLGPLSYGNVEEHLFLGREVARTREVSPATSQKIDLEVRAIADQAYARAKELVSGHREEAGRLAEALLEHEVLVREDIVAIVSGRPATAETKLEQEAKKERTPVEDAGKREEGGDEVPRAAAEGLKPRPAEA